MWRFALKKYCRFQVSALGGSVATVGSRTFPGCASLINVVVEACSNFARPVWLPLPAGVLTSGSVYFADPQWTNYPGRFYRLRSP